MDVDAIKVDFGNSDIVELGTLIYFKDFKLQSPGGLL